MVRTSYDSQIIVITLQVYRIQGLNIQDQAYVETVAGTQRRPLNLPFGRAEALSTICTEYNA